VRFSVHNNARERFDTGRTNAPQRSEGTRREEQADIKNNLMNETDGCPATNRHGEPCGHPAGWGTDNDTGACKFHGGKGGAPEGNDNAVTVGAYREQYIEHLPKEDKKLIREGQQLLSDDATAQEIGEMAASLALQKFRESGDEKFLRRFESLCDTFEIAPEDVQRHEHAGGEGEAIQFDVTRTVVSTDEHK